MKGVRRGVFVLAAVAFLVGAYLAVTTIRFVLASRKVTGTVVSREKVGLRSWEIAVAYPSGDGGDAVARIRGYYNDAAHAPGARLPLRVEGTAVRLAAGQELVILPLVAGLLGGLLVWIGLLIPSGTGRGRGDGAGEAPPEGT
ncbi:MAG: hypothetical protein Kow0092_37650 [Deferrisomatales bacterium]